MINALKYSGDVVTKNVDLFGNKTQYAAPASPLHYFYSNDITTRLIIKPTGVTLCRVSNRKLRVMDGRAAGILKPCQSIDEVKERYGQPPQPKNNETGRAHSKKAVKRIKKSIGFIVLMSRQKARKTKGINHTFRVNFITLTLPALQAHRDETIKRECLNHFLTKLRQLGVRNFCWVAEATASGNIHFHIATDSYIQKEVVLTYWNNIIDKLGYVTRYAAKMSALSFADYCKQYATDYNGKKRKISDLRATYERGVSCGWRKPPTTKIHAVYNLSNVASYMTKYMTKSPDEIDIINSIDMTRAQRSKVTFSLKARRISGRKWGQSQSVSGIDKNIGNYLVEEGTKINWQKALKVVNTLAKQYPNNYCESDFSMHVGLNPVILERAIPRFMSDIRQQIRAGGFPVGLSPN